MLDNEAWTIIRDVCSVCGHPEIADRIHLKWSNRLVSSLGVARTKMGKDCVLAYSITLSTKLFARAPHKDQVDTVAHETCHLIDGIVNYCRLNHGAAWKGFMRQGGFNPKRCCSTVSNAGLVKRFIYECPNECQEFELSTRMHNSIVRGRHRHCRKCKGPITFTGKVTGPETF